DAGQRDDEHPQDDVRDQERRRHVASRSRRYPAAFATSPSNATYRPASVMVAAITLSQSTAVSGRSTTGAIPAKAIVASPTLRPTSHHESPSRPADPTHPQSIRSRPRRRFTAMAAA